MGQQLGIMREAAVTSFSMMASPPFICLGAHGRGHVWQVHSIPFTFTCKGGESMKKKKRPITPFGKDVKRRLIDLEQDQAWLIGEVRARTGLYFDSSYMYKIQTGQLATPSIVNAICDILAIKP
nr:MAG TPA: hypothetical protein [Bacteriophage sp.]